MWKKKYAQPRGDGAARTAAAARRERQAQAPGGGLTLDKHILSEIVRKKSLKPARRRELVDVDAGVVRSEPESCVPAGADLAIAVPLSQPSARPGRAAPPDARAGSGAASVRYRRIHVLLRREGWRDQHEARAAAVSAWKGCSCAIACAVASMRVCIAVCRRPRAVRMSAGAWILSTTRSMDGRAFRVLTVVDQWSRWSPILEVAQSMSGAAVAEALDRAIVRAWHDRSRSPSITAPSSPRVRSMSGPIDAGDARLHPARKACRKRLHRIVQRQAARRVFERQPVLVVPSGRPSPAEQVRSHKSARIRRFLAHLRSWRWWQ